jgi:hypothetical protein
VSLEGYVAGSLLLEGLKRAGPQLDTEKLVEALETVRDFDMGRTSNGRGLFLSWLKITHIISNRTVSHAHHHPRLWDCFGGPHNGRSWRLEPSRFEGGKGRGSHSGHSRRCAGRAPLAQTTRTKQRRFLCKACKGLKSESPDGLGSGLPTWSLSSSPECILLESATWRENSDDRRWFPGLWNGTP